MAGFLVCWAVRRLLTTGHSILSPKSLSNTRQPPANTDLMLLVATQSWHCASSCVSGYNQDNIKHNRHWQAKQREGSIKPEGDLKDYRTPQCIPAKEWKAGTYVVSLEITGIQCQNKYQHLESCHIQYVNIQKHACFCTNKSIKGALSGSYRSSNGEVFRYFT